MFSIFTIIYPKSYFTTNTNNFAQFLKLGLTILVFSSRLTRRDRHMRERDLRMRRREKLKLARLQRRLRRKEQNRRRLKKQKNKRKRDSCSVDSEKLNCFTHNNEHWKTAPLWTGNFTITKGLFINYVTLLREGGE